MRIIKGYIILASGSIICITLILCSKIAEINYIKKKFILWIIITLQLSAFNPDNTPPVSIITNFLPTTQHPETIIMNTVVRSISDFRSFSSNRWFDCPPLAQSRHIFPARNSKRLRSHYERTANKISFVKLTVSRASHEYSWWFLVGGFRAVVIVWMRPSRRIRASECTDDSLRWLSSRSRFLLLFFFCWYFSFIVFGKCGNFLCFGNGCPRVIYSGCVFCAVRAVY